MKRTALLTGLLFLFCAAVLPWTMAAETLLPVIDLSDRLSWEEYEELSDRLEALRETYGIDAVFVISDELTADSVQAEADDVYDYCGYGLGENRDGILYLVCDTTHEYAFSTCGEGMNIFNDDGLEYMDKAMLPHLREGDYYQAGLVYAEKCEELMELAANGTPYRKKINPLYVIAGILLLPLLAAFFLMSRRLSKMNTAVLQTGATQYTKPGSMNINQSRDIFLYSTVTKLEKTESESTTHTSSSGTTHGGRSGSF